MTKGRAGIGVITCSRCGIRSSDITAFKRSEDGLVCRDESACESRQEGTDG